MKCTVLAYSDDGVVLTLYWVATPEVRDLKDLELELIEVRNQTANRTYQHLFGRAARISRMRRAVPLAEVRHDAVLLQQGQEPQGCSRPLGPSGSLAGGA